jgi:hypothetical protein
MNPINLTGDSVDHNGWNPRNYPISEPIWRRIRIETNHLAWPQFFSIYVISATAFDRNVGV